MTRGLTLIPVAKPQGPDDLEVSISIELEDGDLLDIDGSDDQTVAFASRAAKRRLARADKQLRPAAVRVAADAAEDLRATNPLLDHQAYVDPPTLIEPSVILSLGNAPPLPPTVRTPQAPAHFWRPTAPRSRKASESYPPVSVMLDEQAAREVRSSRLPWAVAGIIAVLLLLGGSLRFAPQVAAATRAAASEPPPAAVVFNEVDPKAAPEPAKVVTFTEDEAVSIKHAKPFAPAHHAWAPPHHDAKPAGTTKLPDGSLSIGEDKKDKTADKGGEKAAAAHKKTAEEKELEDLQLRAAER